MREVPSATQWRMPALTRQQKITFAEMRAAGVRGLLIYCSDYKCAHSVEISADRWGDEIRLSNIEPLFVCRGLRLERRRRPPQFRLGTRGPARGELRMTRAGSGHLPLAREAWPKSDVRMIRGEVSPWLSLHTSVGCVGNRTDKQNCALYTILS